MEPELQFEIGSDMSVKLFDINLEESFSCEF